MTFPCPRCGARADVDCGHRPFDDQWNLPVRQKHKGPGGMPGGGNYRMKHRLRGAYAIKQTERPE